MRILHSVQDYSRTGGIGTYLLSLVHAQQKLGHVVKVECNNHDPGSVDAISPNESELFKPDVIHAHDYWRAGWGGDAVVVRSLHNHDFSCSSRTRYLGKGEPCFRAHGAACVSHWLRCSHSPRLDRRVRDYAATTRNLKNVLESDAVVAYSRYVGDIATRNGVDRAHVTVLPCPIERFDANLDYRRSTPGLVSYFGRLARPKGVRDLVEAIGTLPLARLRVVGDGYQRTELNELAEKVAPGRVEFYGWASPGELPRLYEESSVVVMPGRWPEPFGLVGIEAAWAGRPVIASESGGTLDWLEAGTTGLVTRPGDRDDLVGAISQLLTNPEQGALMGAAARARMESWPTSEEHARSLVEEVYAKALR